MPIAIRNLKVVSRFFSSLVILCATNYAHEVCAQTQTTNEFSGMGICRFAVQGFLLTPQREATINPGVTKLIGARRVKLPPRANRFMLSSRLCSSHYLAVSENESPVRRRKIRPGDHRIPREIRVGHCGTAGRSNSVATDFGPSQCGAVRSRDPRIPPAAP